MTSGTSLDKETWRPDAVWESENGYEDFLHEVIDQVHREGDIGHLRDAIATRDLDKIKILLDRASTEQEPADTISTELLCSQQDMLRYGRPEFWIQSCLERVLIPLLQVILSFMELLGCIICAILPIRIRFWCLYYFSRPYEEPVPFPLPYGIDLTWARWVKTMGVRGDKIMDEFLRRGMNLGDWSDEDSVGNDLLRWAVVESCEVTLQALLDLGMPTDGSGAESCVPLALAVARRRTALIPVLLPRALGDDSDFWTVQRTSYCEDGYGETIFCMAFRGTRCRPLNPDDIQDVLMIMTMLFGAGADPNSPCQGNTTPLSLACQELFGSDIIEFLLGVGVRGSISLADSTGFTALHHAIKNICPVSTTIRNVNQLLQHEAPVNVLDDEGHSPLWYVADSGPNECIISLLECGAIVDLCQKGTSTPLMEACRSNIADEYQKAHTLIHFGAAVNATVDNLTPLLIIFREGLWSKENLAITFTMVQLLLDHSAHVVLASPFAQPLIEAAKRNHAPITGLILEEIFKLDLDCEGLLSDTLFALCFETEYQQLLGLSMRSRIDTTSIERLLNAGVSATRVWTNGWTILHGLSSVAAKPSSQDDHRRLLKLILDKGADVDALNNEKRTPLHCAVENSCDANVSFLLTHGAKMNPVDSKGLMPIHVACSKPPRSCNGYIAAEDKEMSNNPQFQGKRGKAAYEHTLASRYENRLQSQTDETIIYHLLSYGADPRKQDNKGKPCLHLACQMGNVITAGALLGRFDTMNWQASAAREKCHKDDLITQLLIIKDSEKRTALHWAAISGNADLVYLILTTGATPSPRGFSAEGMVLKDVEAGRTPYFLQEDKGTMRQVLELTRVRDIQAVSESPQLLNQTDSRGYTALHYAAEQGSADIIEVFRELKCLLDETILTGDGKSALQLAELNEHWDAFAILSSALAR